MKEKFLLYSIILTATISGCISETEKQQTADQPNVILIITDDQGYGDLGFYGNPDIKTPVLDKLAKQSTRFSNFYVCPVCAPTRSSIMTGRYSLRTGVYDTYNGGAIMATEETTIAEILRDNGYTTGIFGKWHLGDAYPFRPQDQGFTESLIHPSGGIGQVGDIYNYFKFDSSYFDPVLLQNGKAVETKGYCSDVFTDGAIQFVEANLENPFFLYLSFNAPHTPLQLPEKYYQQYADLEFDTSKYGIKGHPIKEMNEFHAVSARKVYGMVTNIDDNIGRLFDKLNELNIEEKTLVIFITDNGPQQIRYTAGLRGKKGTVYEGGIKVPCFMHFPGYFPNDKEIGTAGAHIDLLPTILDFCNIKIPTNICLDGKSLLPLVKTEDVEWAERPLFFHWQRGYPEPYRNIAVRKGSYKLVGHTGHDADISDFELFNLSDDPYEMENLSSLKPVIATELKNEFDQWYEEIMKSPNLKPQPIQLGTSFENPVILNRNDAKGSAGIWAQEKIYGYWDVAVMEEGYYDISFVFRNKIARPGNMLVRVGTTQRTLAHSDTTVNTILIKDIYLFEGEYMFESWYRQGGDFIMPFYVTVKKNDTPPTPLNRGE
ncbi:MAG: arylsulfatase [Bacteroidales bacterium]|nr:arylsulfatase [Bacteroidales bacterium]